MRVPGDQKSAETFGSSYSAASIRTFRRNCASVLQRSASFSAATERLSHDCNIPVLSFTGELKRMTALQTKPPSDIAEAQGKPLAGLVSPFASIRTGRRRCSMSSSRCRQGKAGSGSISTSPICVPAITWPPRPSFPTRRGRFCLRRRASAAARKRSLPLRHPCRSRLRAERPHRGNRLSALCPHRARVHLLPPASAERYRSDSQSAASKRQGPIAGCAARIDCRADDRVARPFCRWSCRSARPGRGRSWPTS